MSLHIVNKANSWLGTKFKHQGRVKRTENDSGGCDCLGLIMGSGFRAKNGKLLEQYDKNNYPKLITSNVLLENLNMLLETVAISEIKPGDVILIRINDWPQHLVLVVDKDDENITIIHSYLQARKVVKQYLPKEWYKNIVAVYRSYNS